MTKIDINKEYAFYLRKSRADLELEKSKAIDTLQNHETMLKELANSLNINIAEKNIYREIVSGETISARPVIQDLLSKIETGIYAGVFVVEIERLARGNTMDQGIIAQTFQYTNTLIITPTKTYDPENEFDEEYFEFGLFMSRREYKAINRRIQRGRVANTKKGLYVGSIPPYGYDKQKLKGEKGHILIINKKEAKIVKLIFKCFNDDNIGTTSIAKYLNSLGIKPRKNNQWTASCVRNILTSPANKGYLTWNKRKVQKNLNNGKISKTRPINNDFILIKGKHEPIINENLWNQTQKKINSHKNHKTNSNHKLQNPLAGIVFCELCGKKMIRRPYNNGYPDMLICNTPNCPTISSNLKDVEKQLLDALVRISKNYNYYLKSFKPKNKENIQNTIEVINSEIFQTNNQIEKACELVEIGAYDIDTYIKRTKQLKEKLNNLQNLKEIKSKELKLNNINQKSLIPKLNKVLKDYNKITSIEGKNKLLSTIISKVTYSKDKGGKDLKDNFTLKIFPKI